ncbi:MAG: lipocalin family protein [Paludibacteraceae bacterium]|nr:lipocalin family protein [Paludibacteraceae bacterium]
MKRPLFSFLFCSLFPLLACTPGRTVDVQPVAALDVQQYLGAWYEIARIDHSFERNMTNTMAYYSLNSDGSVRVVNSGWKGQRYKMSEGHAKLTDTPALLRVSFFGPFYSDYRVLWIQDDYNLSLVGGGSDDYLWILSRTPSITDGQKEMLLGEIQRRGYDASRLLWVDQSENLK